MPVSLSAPSVISLTNTNRTKHTGGIAKMAEKRDWKDFDGEWFEGSG